MSYRYFDLKLLKYLVGETVKDLKLKLKFGGEIHLLNVWSGGIGRLSVRR